MKSLNNNIMVRGKLVRYAMGAMLFALTLSHATSARGEGIAALPDPLTLWPRHSADTQGDAFTIDTSEVDRVVTLWQAGSYALDAVSIDGFMPGGPTPTNGLHHSADHSLPAWSLGYQEMARFMALSRASAYRYEQGSVDGFAPEADGWTYLAPAPGSTPGATRYVSASSTNPIPPFDTLATAATGIQDALDVAGNGDLILVDAGLYNAGMISNSYGLSRIVVTAGVTIASMQGPQTTIIEGSTNEYIRGVMLQHTQAVFTGFTVTKGSTRGNSPFLTVRDGGGMLILAAASVSSCLIHNNTGLPWGYGGGIYANTMRGTISDISVYNNQAYIGGGIAVSWGYSTTINRARIYGNTAKLNGGGLLADNARLIYNLVVYDNHADGRGGGISLSSNSEIWFSTIADNTSSNEGAGIGIEGTGNSVRNCIIYNNEGKDVYSSTTNNALRYSFASTLPETGLTIISNVATAPVFVNETTRNYRVRSGSATINQGESASWMGTFTDQDLAPRSIGPAPDPGAFEREEPAISATPAFYIPGQQVDVFVDVVYPVGRRMLTYGVQLGIPAGWQLVAINGTPSLTASPDGVGYLAVGDLGTNATLALTLLAPTNATGAAELLVSVDWMTPGMEDVETAHLAPYPFEILPLYPVTAIAMVGGNLSSTGGWYAAGAFVELTAQPESGWRFGQWLGNLDGAVINGNQITLSVTTGATVYAEFVRVHGLTINSLYGSTVPGIGISEFDTGSIVTSSMLTASVEVGSTNYVCAGWTGTGSAPAAGSDRSVAFTLTEDSSITWQWSWFNANHASRGYRAAGRMASIVECEVLFQPSATITQVWWRPVLPPGWTLESAGGAANPIIDSGLILMHEQLATGHVTFNFDVTAPTNSQGVLTISGEAGVNEPH